MLSISKRGHEMPSSPIRKLVPFAEAAKKKGIKVFHLNIGQPDIETPKVCLDAVRNADFKVLEYSHSGVMKVTAKSWWNIIRKITSMSIITKSSSRQVEVRPFYLGLWLVWMQEMR